MNVFAEAVTLFLESEEGRRTPNSDADEFAPIISGPE